jgi:tetratricopeptide (TPR) repeat protein
MLRERRRALHVELFRTIRSHYRDRLEEQVERLAYHARAGELWDDAVENLYLAAEKAIRRSAHRQAAELLAEGLELIAKLPEGSERLRRELNFHKAMGVTMMAAKGWAAPEVANAYAQARAISERLGDQHELFVALRGQGQFHMIRGELVIARDLGDRCMALVKDEWDVGAHIESHHLFWSTGFFMGDYANAEHHAGRGMALYERERDHRLTYMYSGHDPGVCCRCFSALLLWQQGYAEKALRRGREALDLALSVSHPLTIALTYWAMSYLHLLRREPEQSRHWAEHEIAVCDEYMLPLLHSQGTFQVGWALAAEGIVEQGLERMRAGLEELVAEATA